MLQSRKRDIGCDMSITAPECGPPEIRSYLRFLLSDWGDLNSRPSVPQMHSSSPLLHRFPADFESFCFLTGSASVGLGQFIEYPLDRVAFLVEWLDLEFFGAYDRFDQGLLGLFGGFASIALGDHHVPDGGPFAATVDAGEQHVVDERLVVVDALRVEPEVRPAVR